MYVYIECVYIYICMYHMYMNVHASSSDVTNVRLAPVLKESQDLSCLEAPSMCPIVGVTEVAINKTKCTRQPGLGTDQRRGCLGIYSSTVVSELKATNITPATVARFPVWRASVALASPPLGFAYCKGPTNYRYYGSTFLI